MKRLVCAAALALLPASVHAQAAPIAGTYRFEQNMRYRNDDGSTQELKGEARLTLELKGDSIHGVWQVSVEGAPRQPRPLQLRGTATGTTLRLRSEPQQARLLGPDGERAVETYQEYVLTVDVEGIAGAIHTYAVEGGVEIPPRELRGTRETK